MRRLTAQAYTVAWLCALPLSELVVASAMLDEEHKPPSLPVDDENIYTFGSINGHNVVISCMPRGLPGKISALKLVQPLNHNFPNLKIHLFVGIGGGVPRIPPPDNPEKDIHLGDVVIGWAEQTGVPGIVQWDLVGYLEDQWDLVGYLEDGNTEALGILEKPDRRLLSALGLLLRNHILGRTRFPEHLGRLQNVTGFSHPGLEHDKLFKSTYHHVDGSDCSSHDRAQLAKRPPRLNQDLIFHQGTIISGNSVMKNPQTRDKISQIYHNALCFEMEGAGVMNGNRCLVIRSIANYADSHENNMWQNYAAATAAAFTREFLFTIPPSTVNIMEPVGEFPLSSNTARTDTAAMSTAKVDFMVPLQRNGDLIGRPSFIQTLENDEYLRTYRGSDSSKIKLLNSPPPRSSTFTYVAESDSSETESTASSMWSYSSKLSASSNASINDTLVAALDEVIDVFMSDKDLRRLFAEAFVGQDRAKISRNAVRLLKWLGQRLMVAANTPVEKEAAKFFLGRRHDQAIIDRIAVEIVTQSSKKEKKGQIKELRQHESAKQERLKSYLQQMKMSTTNLEPEETGKVLSNGESDSSSDSDEEKDKKQTVQWNVNAVKLFLKSGDAFARFKEELEDLISPFRNEAMWTKKLWNGRERVRFEHSNNVPRLTMIDKLKLVVEEVLGLPILWWPLKQPRKHLPSSKVRIIWICECGDETYIDVSCAKARRYRQMCDTKPVKSTAAQPSTLPTHNTSLPSSSGSGGLRASTSALIGKATRNLQQRFRGNESARSASQGSEQDATIDGNPPPDPKYINWCVDSAPSRTFRHSICLEEKKEKYFIDELYKSYKKLRGWRWYLSMTTCAEIKLVKYVSVHRVEEEPVICDYKGDVLPNLNDQNEYTYKIDPPELEKEIHIRRAERALIDYYHGYKRCNATNRLDQLILGIPHRVTGENHGLKGYGIWARQGWTIPRLVAFFLVTQGWAIVFMAVWLWYHPGDVQNAFSPGYYSLGLVTVFVAIPDLLPT